MTRAPVVGVVGLDAMGRSLVRALSAAGVAVISADPADGAITAVSDTDIVIESVRDSVPEKIAMLRTLHETCRQDAVLVTTSRHIPVARLAVEAGRPAAVVGLRMLFPPSVAWRPRLIATSMTAPATLQQVGDLLAAVNAEPIDVSDRAMELADELILGYLNAAADLADQSFATSADIDTAMRAGCALPLGPLELLDRIGLDRAHEALRRLHIRTGEARYQPSRAITDRVAEGHLGTLTGRGFHHYDADGTTLSEPAFGPDGGYPLPGSVGVVGSGLMARGIAEVVVTAGIHTRVVAREQSKAEAVLAAVEASMAKAVQRGRLTAQAAATARGLLAAHDELSALAECDVVIEAVAERMDVKQKVFADLAQVCRPDALLATTTSSLSVTECARAASRGAAVVGLHFFNPAPVMKLVEVVRTGETGTETLVRARALIRALGKQPVDSTDRAGFIVNYLLLPYLNHAVRLLAETTVGAGDVDAAVVRAYGHPMGPFALLDTIGLDVSLEIERRLHEHFEDPGLRPSPLLRKLVDSGALGRKSGRGFYHYDDQR